MQLRVIKADGTEEEYFHTKVIATLVNAFAAPNENNTSTAQQLADAVTFYLYNKNGSDKITSSEILSIIKAVLVSTGFSNAAEFLTEHQQRRNLSRMRVKVIKTDMKNLSVSTPLLLIDRFGPDEHWNLDPATARTVASLVEEKILDSGFRFVPTGFIKFLTLWQAQVILSAARQIKTRQVTAEPDLTVAYNADTDVRLRQPQNGFCQVEA
jgi:hypothetical protein